jgi:hypothetical protein
LRGKFGFREPIEIWQSGEEVSKEFKARLEDIPAITMRNVLEFETDAKFWRGFQIKAFACKHTSFDEFILCDADATFLRNPAILWNGRKYKATGAYFFRDLMHWKFSNLGPSSEKSHSTDFFEKRRQWLRSLLPTESPYFPKEWHYTYENAIPTEPVAEAYMESGVVCIDRNRHAKAIDRIYELNRNYEETYQMVWGDKETFWIGFCMASEPYTMNWKYPTNRIKLTQYYGLRKFYIQK